MTESISPDIVASGEPTEGLDLSNAEPVALLTLAVPKQDCHSDSDDETPEEVHELRFERNWRNRNELTELRKGRKRTYEYMDPRPELGIAMCSRKQVAMNLLPNGNLCPSFVDKRKRYVGKIYVVSIVYSNYWSLRVSMIN